MGFGGGNAGGVVSASGTGKRGCEDALRTFCGVDGSAAKDTGGPVPEGATDVETVAGVDAGTGVVSSCVDACFLHKSI